MIEKLSTFKKSAQEPSHLPVEIPVESGEPMMIKLEPNLTTFENENHKNGASCPICGKTFSQECHKTFFFEPKYQIVPDSICALPTKGCYRSEPIGEPPQIGIPNTGRSKYSFKIMQM